MPAIASERNCLTYKGSNGFKQRLLLSVLSGKPVKIIDIRTNDDDPGLREFEINLIRLLDKITNGTNVEISETGTSLYFQPGLLHGGTVEHECSTQRSVGYYLEALCMLGYFCKIPLNVTLRGVICNSIDPSADHIKISMLPVMKSFVLDDEGLDIKIAKRGMPPLGGGEVIFKCPIKKNLRPIQNLDFGMVKRIRGISYALRMSPAIANRMVESAKGVFLNFIPDVYINTDQCRGKSSGKSPGFGIHLYAETNKGVFYSSEKISNTDGVEHSIPEEIGRDAANRLLQEIYLGGCTDSACQSIALLFMALGQKDVSKLLLGPLSPFTISFLQHLREFFGVTFKLENYEPEDEDEAAGANKVVATCVGIGYTNINKRTL